MSQQPKSAAEKYAAIAERMGLPIEGDVAELSKEPVGGLMGWHELAVTVRHISEGVGYNYPKLAEGLCQHLGFALARLATLEEEAAAAKQQVERLKGELAEQEVELLQMAEANQAVQAGNSRPWMAVAAKQLNEAMQARPNTSAPVELGPGLAFVISDYLRRRLAADAPAPAPLAGEAGSVVAAGWPGIKLNAVIVEGETPGVFIGFLKEIGGVNMQGESIEGVLADLRRSASYFIPRYKLTELRAEAAKQFPEGYDLDGFLPFKIEYSEADSKEYRRRFALASGQNAAAGAPLEREDAAEPGDEAYEDNSLENCVRCAGELLPSGRCTDCDYVNEI